MNTLSQELQKYIKKLVSPLKNDEDLIPILRKRLTKKEYKMLQMMASETPLDQAQETLHLDKEGYDTLNKKLVKKINQEKLKQELML